MPLTVRLIASTNGASIGNTLRTPKMKNGPRAHFSRKLDSKGRSGPAASGSLDCRAAPDSIDPAAGPALVDLHRPATSAPPKLEFDPTGRPDRKCVPHSRETPPETALAKRQQRADEAHSRGAFPKLPETAQEPSDFSSAKL